MRQITGSSPILGTTATLIGSAYGTMRCKLVSVQARYTNGATVYFGQVDSTASTAGKGPNSTLTSTNGWSLIPGQESPSMNYGADAIYMHEFYAVSSTIGTDRVDWIIIVDTNS